MIARSIKRENPRILLSFTHVCTLAETYMAMLHNVSHKALYKKQYGILNSVIPDVLCLVFGQTWSTYYFHHVKHHHVEGNVINSKSHNGSDLPSRFFFVLAQISLASADNGIKDLSSTRGYQRDSFIQFLHYFLRFFLAVAIELPIYFLRKNQISNAIKTFLGEFGSLFLFAAATYLNVRAGIAVFVIPWTLMRFFMMAANWGQHAFINSAKRDAHSLTILESSYNTVAFNDGFHASHHENSQRHWSEHSGHKREPSCFDNLTIKGDLNFGDVWLLLMTHNYDALEKAIVWCDESSRPSKDVIIEELKRQLKPVAFKES